MFHKAYTFDDVALVPKYSNIESRLEPDLSTWLTTTTQVEFPIVPANMDTVISHDLTDIILIRGGYPIVHRFMDYEQKLIWGKKYPNKIYMSCGVKEEQFAEFMKLMADGANFRGVCFDIAHGHSQTMIDIIKKTRDWFGDNLEIIAGNVCTERAFHDLAIAGASAVKVGIGAGACCLTRMVTGFGVPQFSAIYECGKVAQELRVPLIADGGIRNSRDIVLSLAAGASTVMMGKLFSLTNESAAEKKIVDGQGVFFGEGYDKKTIAKYRGQASKDFQEDFYGGMKSGTVAEGDAFWSEVSGSADALIDQLLGGLRSGLTYGGARTISELRRKAQFVEVSLTYQSESNIRPQ
jgi:IMP dehydrogenase